MRPSAARRPVAFVLCAALSLAGCGVIQDLRAPALPPTPAPRRAPDGAGSIAPDLALISSLPQGDPARQAEAFQAAQDAAELTPTTSNRLRYALALATPGHSGSDPVAAERQLSELLARPETLLPDERMLATVELKQVEQRLILAAENQRLRAEKARETSEKLATANSRLAAEIDENARLRRALQDARAKIEAVTHIERTINDRAAGGSAPP